MREIKLLPEVKNASISAKRTTRAWSAAQGALFAIGVIMLASAIYMHVRLSNARSQIDIRRPQFVELDFDIQDLNPYYAWKTWETVVASTNGTGLMRPRRPPEFLERRKTHARLTQYRTASWVVGAIGLAGIGTAFFVRQKR
ncbi:MAG: hypothetical protein KDB27_16595 [Planctomycetales bacterium]|nr:hypothetical protein [Planctomycetales bacterium]